MRRTPFSIVAVIVLSGLVLAVATSAADAAGAAKTKAPPSLGGLASAGNCLQLAGLSEGLAQAMTGTNGKNIEKTAALLKQFADRTPSGVRADFQTVAAAYQKIADALKGVDLTAGKIPSPAVIAKLSKLGTEINQKALAKAAAGIGAWAKKNCK
ncbi:MAG TPA: hypothetical protein VII51_01720 [Gaiellaceae bacterium]